MGKILYLNKEDILTAHKIGMTEFGCDNFHYESGCVDYRVVEPQTEYFGEEQYPGIFKKAAVYWYQITVSHCFVDGNKRTGMIAARLFLRYNGYKLKIDDETMYIYCCWIAQSEKRPALEQVESWIRRNSIQSGQSYYKK